MNDLLDYSVDSDKDSRIRQDLKKHNWLVIKLVTRLRKESKNVRMANDQTVKHALKRRPSLPVSLPIALYHKFLEMKKQREKASKEHFEEKCNMQRKDSKQSLSESNPLIPREAPKSNVEIPPKVTKDSTASVNIITKNYLDTNKVNYKNSVITVNPPPKSTAPIEIKLCAVPIPLQDTTNNPLLSINRKEQVQTILLSLNKSTQTDNVNSENEEELLNVIRQYGFTKDDLNALHQNSIKNNNNQCDFQNFNEIDLVESDMGENDITDAQSVVDISDDGSNEDLSYLDKGNACSETKENSALKQNVNVSSINNKDQNETNQPNARSRQIFNKVRTCSDLNKLVLSKFYEGVHVVSNKRFDKERVNKELSQTSHSLVDQIYSLFTHFLKNNGKTSDEVTECTLLDNDECEALPRKRKVSSGHTKEKPQNQETTNINRSTLKQLHLSQGQTNESIKPQHVASLQNQETQQSQNMPTTIQNMQYGQECRSILNENQVHQAQRLISFPNPHSVSSAFSYNQNDPRLSRYYNAAQQERWPMENLWYSNRNIQHFQRATQSRYHLQQMKHQNQHLRFEKTVHGDQNYQNIQMQQNASRMPSDKTFEQMLQQQNIYTPSNIRNSYPYNYHNR